MFDYLGIVGEPVQVDGQIICQQISWLFTELEL
jgi:hypothetical protein